MGNKIKMNALNAEMNVAIVFCECWIRIAKACGKLHEFVLTKAKKAHAREMDILREMMYDEFKDQCKRVLEMEQEIGL